MKYLTTFLIFLFIYSCNLDPAGYSVRRRADMIPYSSEGKHRGSFLEDPDYLDLVHYYIDKDLLDRHEYTKRSKTIIMNNGKVGRVVAKGGDVLEIKDGFAYTNGVQIDADLNLRFFYEFASPHTAKDRAFLLSIDNPNIIQNQAKTRVMLASLTLEELNQLESETTYIKKGGTRINILKRLPTSTTRGWDAYNYGPITIPADNYFVLSDNRSSGFGDSRTFGTIPSDWVKATFKNGS